MVSHLLDLCFILTVEVLQHHVGLVLSLDALVYLVVCSLVRDWTRFIANAIVGWIDIYNKS